MLAQLSWKGRHFLQTGEDIWASCGLESGVALQKQAMIQSSVPTSAILSTLAVGRQTNESEDPYGKELGSRTRNPAKRAGGFAQ